MSKQITRRSFLKAGLLTGTAAATGLLLPQSASSSNNAELCTVLDLRKCIGCDACVDACRDINSTKFPELPGPMPVKYPKNRVKIADWSTPEKRKVYARLTPYNWLYIQTAKGRYDGSDYELLCTAETHRVLICVLLERP